MSSSSGGAAARTGFTLVAAFVFSVFWALLCNLLLEFMQVADHPDQLFEITLGQGLPVFLLGSALVWLVMAVVVALTGRLWWGAAFLVTATAAVSYANHVKLQQRQEPLYPSDLDFAFQGRFLADMVGLPKLLLVLLGLCLLTAGTAWLGRRISRARYPAVSRDDQPRLWFGLLGARAITLALCSILFVQAAHFNATGNPIRSAYDDVGARWAWWFQKVNYERNGFVGGFLYNTHVPAMQKPAGYSAATMTSIAQRYSALAARINKDRAPTAIDDVNIVIVLSEAFSDPVRVPGARFAEDPIPFTRSLMARTDSGSMLAQLIGGGTANMEFETLTGMSLAQFNPQMNSPYQMLIPQEKSFPSAVGYLEGRGHRALAVHPYMPNMYKRQVVYPRLGFEEFIDKSKMRDTSTIEGNEFVSDASAFGEVMRQIDDSERPVFLNLVTMQNHYPTDGVYKHPIKVEGLEGERKNLAEGYARGLRYSDEALEQFLKGLTDQDEKVAVIFYGDHLPGFWPDDLSERNGIVMRETPFFLWSNYKDLPHQDRSLTSPTQFLPMLFDALDAPIPPYYALLDELRAEIPAMEQDTLFDDQGRQITTQDLSPRATQLLMDYRLVQYDLSVGRRYSLTKLFPQGPLAQAR